MNEELKVYIKAIVGDFKQKVDDVKKQIKGIEDVSKNTSKSVGNSFGEMAKKIGIVVSAVAVLKKALNFGKECVELASNLQEVQNVTQTVFGNMSGEADKFAKNAGVSYGLSELKAKKYLGTVGAMAKSFGYGTQAALEQAKAITALTGDVASFYNLKSDEAFTKMKAVYTGETEALKELGVVMTENALNEYALANGYGRTTNQMSEQEKVGLRLAFVQERLSVASGDFARTSGGWANQVRVLSLQFENLKAAIGDGLIAVLTPVVKALNVFIGKLIQAANVFKSFVSAIFGSGKTKETANNIGAVSTSLGGASTGAGNTAKNLGKANDKAKELKKTLMGFDELNVLNTSDKSTSGSGGGIADGGANSGDIPDFGDMPTESTFTANFELLADWDKIKAQLGRIKDNVVDTLKTWKDFVIDIAVRVADDLDIRRLGKSCLDVIESATDLAKVFSEVVTSAFKKFYDTGLSPIVKWIGEKLNDALQTAKEHLDDWAKWFKDNSGLIGEFAEFIGYLVSGLWDLIEPLLDKAWETFKNVLRDVRENLQKAFEWILNNKELVVGAIVGITTAFAAYKAALAIQSTIDKVKLALTGFNAVQAIHEGLTWAQVAAQTALNTVMNLNPYALVVAATVGLVAAIAAVCIATDKQKEAWNNTKTSAENLKKAEEELKDAKLKVKEATDSMISSEQSYFDCVDRVKTAQENLKKAEKEAGESGESLYKKVQDGTLSYENMTDAQKKCVRAYADSKQAQNDLKNSQDKLKKSQDDLVKAEKAEAEAKKKQVEASLNNQVAVAKESGSFEKLKDSVMTAFKNGEISAEQARETLGKAMSGMSDSARQTFTKDLPDNLKKGLNPDQYATNAEKFKNFFHNTATQAKDKFQNAMKGVGTFFNNLFTTVQNSAKNLGNKVASAISGAVKSGINGVISVIEKTIGKAVNIINGAIRLINKIPGVNIGTISAPKLPRLAKGGIINSATIAMIGEQGKEAVMPLENNTQWIDDLAKRLSGAIKGTNNNGQTVVVLKVNERELGRATIDSINNITRQTGELQLEI